MAFKKGSNITCRIGKVNDAFDEKGIAIFGSSVKNTVYNK